MPRYDYRCVECDNYFELRQSFSEAGKGTCPQCSGEGRRVYHAVPVIYKGSGFYTTDYGRPKPPVENGSSKSGAKLPSPTATASQPRLPQAPTARESSGSSESASATAGATASS